MNTSKLYIHSVRLLLLAICAAVLNGRGYAAEPAQNEPSSEEKTKLISALNAQLDEIIVPELQFDETPLSDVVEKIRTAGRLQEKGVNVFVKIPRDGLDQYKHTLVTLHLKSGSLRTALEAVNEQTHQKILVDPYAVELIPAK